MGEKSYTTFLIIPEKADRVKKVRLSKLGIKCTSLLALVLLGVFVYITGDYIGMRKKVGELRSLRKETRSQELQILTFANKLSTLEEQMERIREFDKKLRVIANLDDYSQGEQILDAGGSFPEDTKYFSIFQPGQDLLKKQLHFKMQQMELKVKVEEESLQELQEYLQDKRFLLACTPSIWPTKGWVTSSFGYRRSPFTRLREFHKGLDVAARVGTPVISPADGEITYADTKGRLGKTIKIDHGYDLETRYGHLSEIYVKSGQKVKRGDKIGAVGNTGRSTGPHLHYEVRVGEVPVNPRRYILN